MLNNGPEQLVELWFKNLNGKYLQLFASPQPMQKT